MYCTYNVTLRRVRVTIVAVEKQRALDVMSVCLQPDLSYFPCIFSTPPYAVICSLSSYTVFFHIFSYRGADKSLARPGRKQARKHVRRRARFQQHRDASCHKVFFFFLQGKAPKEIHAIPTETLACFLPGRAKDLSAPLYIFARKLLNTELCMCFLYNFCLTHLSF